MRFSKHTKADKYNLLRLGLLALCFVFALSAALCINLPLSVKGNDHIAEAASPVSKGNQTTVLGSSHDQGISWVFNSYTPGGSSATLNDNINNTKLPQIGSATDNTGGTFLYGQFASDVSDSVAKQIYAQSSGSEYQFGIESSPKYNGQITIAIVYEVPNAIKQLVESVYKNAVSVELRFKYSIHDNSHLDSYYVDCHPGSVTAQTAQNSMTSGNGYHYDNDGVGSSAVTHESNPKIVTAGSYTWTLATTMVWNGAWNWSNQQRKAYLSNIRAEYTIKSQASDSYSSPYFSQVDTENTYPYRPNTNNSNANPNWPIYVSGMENTLENAVDKVDRNGANMHSYTNESRTEAVEGDNPGTYYKRLTLEFDASDAVRQIYLQNTSARFNVFSVVDKNGLVNGNWNGVDRFNTNNGEARVAVRKTSATHFSVTIYVYKNFSTNLVFETYNTSFNLTYPISFKGIDLTGTTSSSASISLAGDMLMAAKSAGPEEDMQTIDWLRKPSGFSQRMDVNFLESLSDAAVSRHAIYFTVKKYGTYQELLTAQDDGQVELSRDIINSGSFHPVAAGPSDSAATTYSFNFVYHFDTGFANSVGSGTTTSAPNSTTDATGSGYYIFRFWVYDLAGNEGALLDEVFYAKVDYEQPIYDVDLSYKPDADLLQTVNIDAAHNGAWAKGETTLKLQLQKGMSVSGNTLVFMDGDSRDHIVTVNYLGSITHLDGAPSEEGDSLTMSLKHNLTQNTDITIKFEDGAFIITFDNTRENGLYKDVAWITAFNIYAGAYEVSSRDDLPTGTPRLDYTNTDWRYQGRQQVAVLIDRNMPDIPTLEANEYVIDADRWDFDFDKVERNWYTDGYSYQGTSATFDDDLRALYGNQMKVRVGVKYIDTRDALAALKALDLKTKFTSATFDEGWESTWFDKISDINNFQTEAQRAATIDLLQANNGGLRVLFVWSEDQAGNISKGFSLYYILADARTYTFATTLGSDSRLGNTASMRASATSGIKRGARIDLTFVINQGYVPYKFNIKIGEVSTTVLENYLPRTQWTLAEQSYDREYASGVKFLDADDFVNANSMSFIYDTPDSFAPIEGERMEAEFIHRKIVTASLHSFTVTYDRKPVDISKIVEFSDETAKNEYVIVFLKDGKPMYKSGDGYTTDEAEAERNEGGKQYYIPKDAGEYGLRIYLEKDNAAYVDETFTMDGVGNQNITDNDFNILKAAATVTPDATQSTFGEEATLTFKVTYLVDGIPTELSAEDQQAEGIQGSLALNVVDFTTAATLGVGNYEIIEGETFEFTSGNFTVQFTGGVRHSIVARVITVSTWDASKTYGDRDPEHFPFAIGTEQFKPGEEALDIIKSIFLTLEFTQQDKDDKQYYVCATGSYILRAEGEDVNVYDYLNDASLFDGLSSNYKIEIDNTVGHFTIEKRDVTLDVSGQSVVLQKGTEFRPQEAKLTYAIASKDSHLRAEIESIVKLKLADAYSSDNPSDGYEHVYSYDILLDGEGNENITLKLGDDHTYLVYIADGKAIIISLKDAADFGFVFGLQWSDDTLTYEKFKDNFDVTSEEELPDFDNIEWTCNISGVQSGTYIPAGSYLVTLTGLKLTKGGSEVKDERGISYNVFANSFSIVVDAAKVTVKPVVRGGYERIYGEEDSKFDIGFEVTAINDQSFTSEQTYAEYEFSRIVSLISGTFARGKYASTGDFSVVGARYDDATDDEGNILAEGGGYYALHILRAFSISDNNFAVETDLGELQHFVIKPYSLKLTADDFKGVNKSYDGSTEVRYSDPRDAYDLDEMLVRPTDEVLISMTANYLTEGSPNQRTETGIKIENIALTGAQAHNYVISSIKRTNEQDGHAQLYSSEGVEAEANADTPLTDSVYAVIYYLDNNTLDIKIYISAGSIGIKKSDFAVSKVYDNNYSLTLDAIQMFSNSDVNGVGSTILFTALKNGLASLVAEETSLFPGKDVSDKYIVSISIFFEVGDINNYTVLNNDEEDTEYKDASVTVVGAEYGGKLGIKVVVSNITARITKRVLDANSFSKLETVDRDYNGLAAVNIDFMPSDDALAVGDTLATVGITLRSAIDGEDFGVGEHTISFANCAVFDSNYEIYVDADDNHGDCVALNALYADEAKLTVNITPAKLLPNGTFTDREYDGQDTVVFVQNSAYAESPLTTVNYPIELADELKNFKLDGGFTYKLSKNGAADANVAVDEEGNVIRHNVLISGLKIVEDGDNNYLKNYVIYGERYNPETTEYEAVGAVPTETVGDFEIVGAVMISKRTLTIMVNDINITPHVYDTTTNAVVTANLPEKVLEEHREYLEIFVTGNFKDYQVGSNITVVLSGVRLQVKSDFEQEFGYIADNYYLEPYTGRHAADIVARPVTFGVTIDERTYNGKAAISSNSLHYTIGEEYGLLPEDSTAYAIKTEGGANYIDANVAVDEDGNVIPKSATIFNPTLTSNRGRSNYVLTYGSKVKIDDSFIAVKDTDGNWYYYDEASAFATDSAENVASYYYTLNYTTKFVEAEKAIEGIEEHIVGRYTFNGVDYLAIEESFDAAGAGAELATDMGTVYYYQTTGLINQRAVTFNESGIEKLNESAFTKIYDGTTKFYGEPDVDYRLTTGSVRNVVEGDDISIDMSDINAHFDSALTSAMFVLFEAKSIAGDPTKTNNYKVAGSATIRISASITKRPITATLEDNTVQYGSLISYAAKVTYKLGDVSLTTNANHPYSFFIKFSDYTKIAFEDYDSLEEAYRKELYDNTYDYDAELDNYIASAEGSQGEWLMISFNSLPLANYSFDTVQPDAGTDATVYNFANMGDSFNFMFEAEYTNKDTQQSKLTVVKKLLFVAPDGRDYVKFYAGSNPQVTLSFMDDTGNVNTSFAVGQTAQDVFTVDGRSILPEMVLKIFNTKNPSAALADVGKYPKISSDPDLPDGSRYVIALKAPDGVNYESDIKNYQVYLIDAFEYVEGVIRTKFGSEYKGSTINASTVSLELDVLQGLSESSVLTGSYVYDGNDKAARFILGTQSGDKVFIEGDREVVNVGTYEGHLKVTRPVKIDDEDSNGYIQEWTSPSVFSIVITPADPGLTVKDLAATYSGNALAYSTRNGVNIRFTNGNISWNNNFFNPIVITMADPVTGQENVVTEIKNAGEYKIKISLSDAFIAEYRNYEQSVKYARYTVSPADVKVAINTTGYKDVTGRGEQRKRLRTTYSADKSSYDVDYTVTTVTTGLAQELQVNKSETKLVFERAIDGPGIYGFKIVLNSESKLSSNYRFTGCDGMLELTALALSANKDNDNVQFVTADEEPSEGIIANRLVVRRLQQAVGSADDIAFFNKVEAYMPYIRQLAKLEDMPKLASVYRFSLYYNTQSVGLDGNFIKISVATPTNIKNMDNLALYVSTKDGGLVKLEDYSIVNGKVEYTTDYLGALVFVDLTPDTLPSWLMYLIIVLGSVVGVALLWSVVSLVVRKAKLKKMM